MRNGDFDDFLTALRPKVFDPETSWFFFNRIWFEPEDRERLYSHFVNFAEPLVTRIKEQHSNVVLLAPEGLSSSFGAIPFAFYLAQGLSLPIMIWKEFADEFTAAPRLFPDRELLSKDTHLVVVNDVVANGSILRKLASYFSEFNMQPIVSLFVTILKLQDKSEQLESNLEFIRGMQPDTEMLFKSLLTSDKSGHLKFTETIDK